MPYAIITGATGGLGKEFAREFSKLGLGLVLIGQDKDKLASLRLSLSKQTPEIVIISANLSSEDGIEYVIKQLEMLDFAPKYLVLNAGAANYSSFADMPAELIESCLNLNVNSHVRFTKQVLDKLGSRDECNILFVSSTSSLKYSKNMALYAAAKAYMNTFILSLANEYRDNPMISFSLAFIGQTNTGFAARAGIGAHIGIGVDAAKTCKALIRSLLNKQPVIVYGWKCKLQYHLFKLLPMKIRMLLS